MAIRFCLVAEMIPFLEVNVQNYRELSDTNTIITDVDVLGFSIDTTGTSRRIVFDCKTLKTSPINRAFWANGLLSFTGCHESFVILRKRASEAHRLSAKRINVHLFDESQFNNYAESTSIDYKLDYCYSSNINSWLMLLEASNGNIHLQQFIKFIAHEIPLENDFPKALRRFLAALKKVRGELNPDKVNHLAIFYYSVSIFMYLLCKIVHDLRNVVDYDADGPSFSKTLTYYVWGGKDSFLLKKKISKTAAANNSSINPSELSLGEWSKFMELVRSFMDAPSQIMPSISPIREIAFSKVIPKERHKDEYISKQIRNKRARQFITLSTKYLVSANKLPADFLDYLTNDFSEFSELSF